MGTLTRITIKTIQYMTKEEIQVGIGVEKDSQGQGLGRYQKVEGVLIHQELIKVQIKFKG